MAKQGIPLIDPLINMIIGSRNDRFVKRYNSLVEQISAQESSIRAMTDDDIRQRAKNLRTKISEGTSPEDVLVDVFAVGREAMDRSIGVRSIFNPDLKFDASQLPPAMQDLYKKVAEQAKQLPLLIPRTFTPDPKSPSQPHGETDEANEFLGATAAIQGWKRVQIPIELYNAVRDLYHESKPPFRARPFDVQLIGGMVLYQGKIAEMKTGEGKTIVAPLAAALVASDGMKVHIVTVNDYLVQRDRDWTSPFFHALGLTVGAIHPQHIQPEGLKRLMYTCDIVYGTTSEFGFDYLRDNMKPTVDQQVQRRRDLAIVDEVDSTLIDEARTPLIISGPAHTSTPRYDLADGLARFLVEKQRPWQELDDRVSKAQERIKGLEGDIRNTRDKSQVPTWKQEIEQLRASIPQMELERDSHTQYYEIKEERKQVTLTHDGVAEAQKKAGLGSFYVDENMDIPHLLEQSLRAHVVYLRDRDYIVMDVPDQMTQRPTPSIVIVDTFTGRPMIGRQWSDGLHQAIECKDRVPIKEETQTVATVTIQNFFKMYKRLSGMTGTADTEAQEFHDIYSLDVVSIPTNEPIRRIDADDRMYMREKDKWNAIVDEIKSFHDVGRPILVGTTSVEKSELVATMLSQKYNIKHNILNAKQHEREAHIIEDAGQLGSVMIATNMAGRGTDIKLGRVTRESLRDHWLKRDIAPRTLNIEDDDDILREKVYRKIAPKFLDIDKKQAEELPFGDLELQLLRHWTFHNTLLSERKINSMNADQLRESLDAESRMILHDIRWFDSIENMGGLHVVGTERHDSRRIDNQLRGRAGRQGDKGSSRFFVSTEDDMMRLFGVDKRMGVVSKLGLMKEGDAVDSPLLSKTIAGIQRKVEERNFQYRKQILEYDEVMEHQRQAFYGLRQRVLEGRDVHGLIKEYLRTAITDKADEFLDEEYGYKCIAEYAREHVKSQVSPERMRRKDAREIDTMIRREAGHDAHQLINMTLGEYMPDVGSDVQVEFDAIAIVNWAKSRFGVDLDISQVESGGVDARRSIQTSLEEAAVASIETTDLDRIPIYLDKNYGPDQLVDWVKRKFEVDVTRDEILRAVARHLETDEDKDSPEAVIMARVDELYANKEVRYPVDFRLMLTQSQMGQNPQGAMQNFIEWANQRYELGLTAEDVMKQAPAQIREKLLEASRMFIDSGKLEKEIADAIAQPNNEALKAHFKKRFGVDNILPDWLLGLKGEDHEQAIQGRVEMLLRSEMLYLEQSVLLRTLDNAWREHLHSMDQLRDGIGFRAMAQTDPRNEFKREGARIYRQMMRDVIDRVTDDVLRVELRPNVQQQPRPQMPPQVPAQHPAGAGAINTGGGIAGGGIIGAGF